MKNSVCLIYIVRCLDVSMSLRRWIQNALYIIHFLLEKIPKFQKCTANENHWSTLIARIPHEIWKVTLLINILL